MTMQKQPICSWCGKPAKAQSGYIIFNDLHEEFAFDCGDSQHTQNPLFESEQAYQRWKEKHPLKSRGVKFQQAIL